MYSVGQKAASTVEYLAGLKVACLAGRLALQMAGSKAGLKVGTTADKKAASWAAHSGDPRVARKAG